MRNHNDLCSAIRRRADASAFLTGNAMHTNLNGMVLFYQLGDGVVVRAEITGLPRSSQLCKKPIFAFHIHNGNSCTGTKADAFANASGHYNPEDCPHPYHAGDLPPLFSVNGRAFSIFFTDRFSVSEILGKAIIIHEFIDDFSTQPSGNAGEKIACGIINPTAR
ncbi:MAG: superoxide dismutase family protein [Clostridia bacterium]|nr:superoxide dismutase family protein [Clostridia bacterium]